MICIVGLADRIVEEHWKSQDKKWQVEYAREIMKNKEDCK